MQGHQIHWDEAQSPQWRYLLNQEHQARKAQRRVEDEQIRIKRVSKRQKIRKATTKKGKPIVYSANPTDRRYSSDDLLGSKTENVGKNKELVMGKSA